MRLRGALFLLAAGLSAAATPVAASARASVEVLVHTRTAITRLGLDPSGRAAWVQDGPPGAFCYRLHRGALLRHGNRVITRCRAIEAGAVRNPLALVATARTSTGPLRIAWDEGGAGHLEASFVVQAYVGGARGHVSVDRMALACGTEDCDGLGFMGRWVGPMAAADGTVLYSVDDVSGVAPCDPVTGRCPPAVTGGRIRRVRYTADGATAVTVPGAPAAHALATAAGRLAEQPFAAGGEGAAQVEIRDVAAGTLRATIAINGTLDTMAMSPRVLAVLVTNSSGGHLVRYSAVTGALLGSTPVGATVDRRTLSIFGPRILYQTARGMFIYRLDLGRTIAVGIGPRRSPALDADGIRWFQADRSGPGSTIRGIELG